MIGNRWWPTYRPLVYIVAVGVIVWYLWRAASGAHLSRIDHIMCLVGIVVLFLTDRYDPVSPVK